MASEDNETPTDPVEAVEPTETAESAEEKKEVDEKDIQEWSDDEIPPTGDEVPEPPAIQTGTSEETEKTGNVAEPESIEEAKEDVPDFSKYRTNVAERLWRATVVDRNDSHVPDIVSYEQEFQDFRKKMGLLNKYVDEYANAMKEVTEKRNKLFEHYALLSKGTPLWDRIGKPLTKEQKSEINNCENLKTLEGVEERTHMIMKIADDIGPGSMLAHQQLAKLQDEMSLLDFKRHTANYIDEWDDIVSSEVDKQVSEVRVLGRKREHYVQKVNGLRDRVNRIERKGKQMASKKLSDQLYRNEKKLNEIDAVYLDKADKASTLLYEATERGWVDYYPVIKNVMKFEINRLGRESACYGSFHSTLEALKTDYRAATAGTVDEPHSTSKL